MKQGRARERYLAAEVLLGDPGDHADLPGLDLHEGIGGLRGEHPRRRRREQGPAEGGEDPPEWSGHRVGAVRRREVGAIGDAGEKSFGADGLQMCDQAAPRI